MKENQVSYWVGVAEVAAEDIAFWQDANSYARGMGYPATDEAELDKAKAAHKNACENIMRILSEFHALIYPPAINEQNI